MLNLPALNLFQDDSKQGFEILSLLVLKRLSWQAKTLKPISLNGMNNKIPFYP